MKMKQNVFSEHVMVIYTVTQLNCTHVFQMFTFTSNAQSCTSLFQFARVIYIVYILLCFQVFINLSTLKSKDGKCSQRITFLRQHFFVYILCHCITCNKGVNYRYIKRNCLFSDSFFCFFFVFFAIHLLNVASMCFPWMYHSMYHLLQMMIKIHIKTSPLRKQTRECWMDSFKTAKFQRRIRKYHPRSTPFVTLCEK